MKFQCGACWVSCRVGRSEDVFLLTKDAAKCECPKADCPNHRKQAVLQ